MSTMLQFRQLEGEPNSLLGGLLHLPGHVHVDLTQPMDNMMWSIPRCTCIPYPQSIHVKHNLHRAAPLSSFA